LLVIVLYHFGRKESGIVGGQSVTRHIIWGLAHLNLEASFSLEDKTNNLISFIR